MDVNFEYYKIFYYVANTIILRGLQGCWETASRM